MNLTCVCLCQRECVSMCVRVVCECEYVRACIIHVCVYVRVCVDVSGCVCVYVHMHASVFVRACVSKRQRVFLNIRNA